MRVILFILLLASATAQPEFHCTVDGDNCSKETGYSRGEVIGCMRFCDVDKNKDNVIDRQEMEDIFVVCAGNPDGECRKELMVPLLEIAIPVCRGEAERLWYEFAAWDGNQNSFFYPDNQGMWDFCMFVQGKPAGSPQGLCAPHAMKLVWMSTANNDGCTWDMWLASATFVAQETL